MWNTFFSEPIRRREVRPEKIPVPERPAPETPAEPQKQPERQPEHVPA
jgi:hypothetical protein